MPAINKRALDTALDMVIEVLRTDIGEHKILTLRDATYEVRRTT
jgi:hypothetical protein